MRREGVESPVPVCQERARQSRSQPDLLLAAAPFGLEARRGNLQRHPPTTTQTIMTLYLAGE